MAPSGYEDGHNCYDCGGEAEGKGDDVVCGNCLWRIGELVVRTVMYGSSRVYLRILMFWFEIGCLGRRLLF